MSEDRVLKNIGASVRQRLANRARERGDEFGWILSRYAVERLLYRLSQSAYANEFVLKGAQLFSVWTENPYRTTRDLDLLRYGDPAIPRLEGIVRSLCTQPVETPDGIDFLTETVQGEEIRAQDDYGGVRICLLYQLAGARDRLQIDVGIGDAVTPAPEMVEYPSLIGFPAPYLPAYPRESVVAEKFQAMVMLGIANSRMKDYYDLYTLAGEFLFEGERLASAIGATFARRKTALPRSVPFALTPEFAADVMKQTQWRAFLTRSRLAPAAPALVEVVTRMRGFLMPPTLALAGASPFQSVWPPAGPWQAKPRKI